MKAWIIAAVLSLSAVSSTASAAWQGPFGCGTFCVCHFGKMHQHGPLYNYGPYYGYYPFEPYGPWTSDLRYNPQCNNGKCGSGIQWPNLFNKNSCNSCGGWGHYATGTLRNVFHRTHPCSAKAGCSSCK